MFDLAQLKQTRVYQEAQQEEALSFVLRLLPRRLGSIQTETQSQLQKLSTTQLEELGEAVLDFTTLEDLLTWLQIHEQNT